MIGACIGEAIAGKKLGKKAMLIGALAQSIPDIDFIAAFWNDTASNLLAHRGFTHSILFAFFASLLFALFADHYHSKHQIGYKKWLLLFGLEIFVHLFLDVFNGYGTGLLEPFSHQRFSFNTIFVADPFFSIWPAIAFVALLIAKTATNNRKFWWRFGLFGCIIYLSYCSFNKQMINTDVREIMKSQKIEAIDFMTSPTPLNNWLWYIVVQEKEGFKIGYRSVFDSKKQIDFQYFPRNDSLLVSMKDHEEIQQLIRFSQGYYTVEQWKGKLVFNDLRFGQIVGWYNPKEDFVFHYFLNHAEKENSLVVQRGRFYKWNRETIRSLVKKIQGN